MPLSSKRNTPTQIANAVLDEARSNHVTVGSIGEIYKYLIDASLETTHTTDSVYDALSQLRKKAIATSPVSNSLMHKVDTNLDTTISSRASIALLVALG